MGVAQFYGELMLEPLCLRPWEIAELTDEQILMAVAASSRRQRDMDGKGKAKPLDADSLSQDEQFLAMQALGLNLGLSPRDIVMQWNALNPGKEYDLPSASLPNFRGAVGLPDTPSYDMSQNLPPRKSMFVEYGKQG